MIYRGYKLPDFIVGGVSKAGTTSLFTYLNAHPEVCGTKRKELYFFNYGYSGDKNRDLAIYSEYFCKCNSYGKLLFEATPEYLAGGSTVAQRILDMLPNVKLLFVLREPVSRLYSFYNFFSSRYEIDEGISFESYVDSCFSFELDNKVKEKLGLKEIELRYLQYGNYATHLKEYLQIFPRENIKVMFFEDLCENPLSFMKELCQFLKIDEEWYCNYSFEKSNQTFRAKRKWIHQLAMSFNTRTETWLRGKPALKRVLVTIYKMLNQQEEGYPPMSDAERRRLEEYYKKSKLELSMLLCGEKLPAWLDHHD